MKRTKKRTNSKKKPDFIVILFILFVVATISCVLFDNLFDSFTKKIKPTTPSSGKTTPHIDNPESKKPIPSGSQTNLTAEDFAIAGLSLETSSATVSNLFGDPLEEKRFSTTSFHNSDYNLYYYYWIYPELEIEFINNAPKEEPTPKTPESIIAIKLKNSFYQTKRGIRVGDTIDQLFEKYGETKREENSYIYSSDLKYLEFSVNGNKISEITVGHWFD